MKELIIQKAKEAAKKSCSPALIEQVEEFNSSLAKSAAREENIQALKQQGTIAVITGQQVGLFLGPLFTFYKALSAIRTAQKIEKISGIRTVPIFWLQSEDHDIEEINHCFLPSPTGKPIKLTLETEFKNEDRRSVNSIKLGENIKLLLTELEKNLSFLPKSKSFLETISKWYKPENTLVQAFAGALSELLKEEGIIFFNPKAKQIAELSKPVFQTALESHQELTSILLKNENQAVHVRENSPLLFFHQDSEAGPRYRIEENNNQWSYIGSNINLSKEELFSAGPERFSSSALLRPLVQDYLFPTVAYIAGKAELEYHKQIKDLYQFIEREQPLILPRASFTLIEEKAKKWLDELNLDPKEIKLPEEKLVEKISSSANSSKQTPEELEKKVLSNIKSGLDLFKDEFKELEPTLLKPLEKTEQKISGQIEALKARYAKALANSNNTAIDHLKRLQTLLYPQNIEQERFYGLAYFYCRYASTLKENILNSTEAFHEETKEIYL